MTEHEYIIVSALQAVRAAKRLYADAHPHFAISDMESDWKNALRIMEEQEDRLEAERERFQQQELYIAMNPDQEKLVHATSLDNARSIAVRNLSPPLAIRKVNDDIRYINEDSS